MTSRANPLPARDGQLSLSEELLAETYDALRRIASRQLSRQSGTPSLNTTLIVHEAWLKLAGDEQRRFNDRNHYLATAARAMRQILVDHARRKATDKRGAGAVHIDIDDCFVAETTPMNAVLTVDEALEALSAHAPELEAVVECRFFGGLTTQETADALGRSVRTVERQWARARAYLSEEFQPE
ncbi:ECF-type sigma factor [Tsuneonella suprasediminis]|uniref:ECF-type sigma factor n=1 Tax=Tsuneonella suprasediminis TaxID=2306996 RepID=UPI002F9352EC